MHVDAQGEDRCVTGDGPNDASIVVVTKAPLDASSRLRTEMAGYLEEAGLNPADIMWCSAIKCRTWGVEANKTDLKTCTPYLRAELDFIQPRFVLTLGAEAWFAASGWADVTKHRGKLYDTPGVPDCILMPTISPSAVARSPGMRGGFIADLRYFARLTRGEDGEKPPFHTPAGVVTNVMTKSHLRAALEALRGGSVVSFDVETTGAAEYEPDARIVSLSFTTATDDGMPSARVWQIPLFHPESPWREKWERILAILAKALCAVPRKIAHNAKFDAKWLRHFGVPIIPTFDTIIALSLLNENEPKGLKPACQQRLGADPWGIDTRDLLSTPLMEVLEYNGLDTWHDLRLYYIVRADLLANRKLARLFKHLMMPLVQELIDVERRGVYVDQERLAANWATVRDTLAGIHTRLMEFVPETPAVVPERFFNRAGELQVNFNASNFARWWLFEYLQLPIMARGKTKDDGSPGDPSMAEAIMMELAEIHPAAKLMVERVGWNKYDNGSFGPWSAQVDHNSRIHTTFKPWGTVTGRLSSGKEDAEKITAGNRNRKGVNLQQVPRNKLARGVFGAPPGWSFVEADYSQIELRLAAFMARETRMMSLYASGQDIHMAMAMQMTGKPASQVTAEERKRAKAVNFGFLYGMGWHKFIMTAWENYGVRVTEEEARAFRVAFFRGFPGLLPWHGRQRRLANKYGRVETPMGRVRHLPDIYSPDQDVRAEAERQAINSPVQAMASDMAALAMVHTARGFRAQGLRAFPVGLVHDAVNFEIPNDELDIALPFIKSTMENLPLPDLFGVYLDVPIVADVKVGKHWSADAIEVPGDTVTTPHALHAWIEEHVTA